MNTNERPEDTPIVDERKTRELCGAERDGARCMRPKGHSNEHEAYRASQSITWSE